jgi:hypothetical protein
LVVIDGHAPGADRCAHEWAEKNNLTTSNSRLLCYPAHWRHGCEGWENCKSNDCKEVVGPAAGPIRNRKMANEGQPHMAFCFNDDLAASKGSLDMTKVLYKLKIPYYLISRMNLPLVIQDPAHRGAHTAPESVETMEDF